MCQKKSKSISSTVVLVGTDSSTVRSIPTLVEKFHLSRWVFIGRDAMVIDKLELALSPWMEKIDIAKDMAEVQKKVRDDYLKYIEEVEINDKDPLWWSSRLAWKNPWRSAFLLRYSQLVCIVKIVKDYKQNGHNLLIVVEEPILQRLIYQQINSKLPDIDVLSIRERRRILTAFIKLILRGCWIRIRYFVFYLKESNKYKRLLENVKANFDFESPSKSKECLCPTFIDSRSFCKGHYSDAFLGRLFESPIFKDFEVIIIPIQISADESQLEQFVNWANSRGYKVAIPLGILPYATLIFQLVRIAKKLPRFGVSKNSLRDFEIRSLVIWERLEEWSLASILQPLLLEKFSYFLTRSSRKEFLLIYPFENQAWERVLLHSLRRYATIYAVGIQNAPCPSLSTRFFLTDTALKQCPLPDVILTNGDVSYEALASTLGAYTRVEKCSLSRPISINIDRRESREELSRRGESQFIRVLVACSTSVFETRELISRIVRALKYSARCEVWIALHPLVSLKSLMRFGSFELPKHFCFSNQSIEELLSHVDIVLFDSSTVGLQALAMGLPVIYVGHECCIHVDPSEYDTQQTLRAYSIDDIQTMVERFDIDNGYMEAAKQPRMEVARKYFGDESLLSATHVTASVIEKFGSKYR